MGIGQNTQQKTITHQIYLELLEKSKNINENGTYVNKKEGKNYFQEKYMAKMDKECELENKISLGTTIKFINQIRKIKIGKEQKIEILNIISAGQSQKLDIAIHPQAYIDIDWYILMFTLKISLCREENKQEHSHIITQPIFSVEMNECE